MQAIVRNERTARDIAVAIIRGQYGDDGLREQEPLLVTEYDGVWTVTGAAEKEHRRREGATAEGATYARAIIVKLRRSTGEVISIEAERAFITHFDPSLLDPK